MSAQRSGLLSGYGSWAGVKLRWKKFHILETFKPNLVISWFPVGMPLRYIGSSPDYAKLKGGRVGCFLIVISMLCHKSIGKFAFLWGFNTSLPLTRRAPGFALASIITLRNTCRVPVCAMHIETEPSGSLRSMTTLLCVCVHHCPSRVRLNPLSVSLLL